MARRLGVLTEAALALRDTEAARRLRSLLAPYSGQQLIAGHFVAVFGPADAYLAALDSLLGDPDSADRLFGAALAQATGFGALIHRAWVLATWATQDSGAQASQCPQVMAPYITTLSPGLNVVTPAPTVAISPEASAPITSGNCRLAKAMPRKPQRSR